MSPPTPQPRFGSNGVPLCSESACRAFDGTRCELLGWRPSNVCEPAVVEIRARAETNTSDTKRYRRLQILGAFIPELQRDIAGLSEIVGVKRFSNLDAILDKDIEIHPSRGEAVTDRLAAVEDQRLHAPPSVIDEALNPLWRASDDDLERRFRAFYDKVTEEARAFTGAVAGTIVLERPPAILVVDPPVRGVIAVLVLHEDTGPGRYKITLNLGSGVQHSFSRLDEAEARALLKNLALSHVPLPVPSETMKNAWAAAADGASS